MMIDFDYLFNKYNIKPDGVLHLGGNTGQEANVYSRFGVDQVIWVEAIPNIFEQLCRNIDIYTGQTAINVCVGDEDGKEVEFNISNNESQSSSYLELAHHKVIHPTVHYVDKFKTIMRRLDKIIHPDSFKEGKWFLNADLQGSELAAFKGMGDLIDDFEWVYTEVNKKNTYEGCALIEDIDYFLLQHDFERVETGQWVADTWTDALYCKIK